MQLFHLHGHGKLDQMIHSDFWLFEFSVWLHVLARSFISIFVPILMFQIGYTIPQILIYYMLYCLLDVPMNFVARALLRKIGARWLVALGTIFVVAFFFTFGVLTPGAWTLLLLLALLAALYDAFYWIGHLYLFVESNTTSDQQGKTEENTGLLWSIKRLARLIGPAVGAAILIFFDSSALIYTSIIVFLLSFIPLYYVDDFKDRPTPDEPQLSFKQFFKDKHERRDYAALALQSLHSESENVIWPLFIFVTLGSLESVALVPVIVSITSIIFSYTAGKLAHKHTNNMIALGATILGMLWLVRLTVDSTPLYFVSIFLVGLFALLVTIPVDSSTFNRAQHTDALSAVTYRNTISMGMKVPFYAVLAVLVGIFHTSFTIAAIAMFALVLLTYYFRTHAEPSH